MFFAWINSIFLFVHFFAGYGKLYSIDSFYHIALSEIVLSNEINFMNFSIYEEHFPGTHYFFQVLLKSFVLINKGWSSYLFIFFSINTLLFVFLYILKSQNSRSPYFFLSLLLFSTPLLFIRLNQIRPIGLSLIFFVLYRYLYMNKNFFWGFLLSLIFSITYSAYYLTYFYLFSCLLFNWNRDTIKFAICSILGGIVGIVVNPSFPNKLFVEFLFTWQKLFSKSPFEPTEWLPFTFPNFISNYGFISLVFFFTIYFIGLKKVISHCKYDILLMIDLINFLFYLTLTIFFQRFSDYLTLFSIVILSRIQGKVDDSIVKRKINLCNNGLHFLLIFIIVPVLMISVNKMTISINRIQAGAEWLARNSSKGEIVVLSSINSFPELIYHNKNNHYIVGMDWKFLELYNKKLATDYELFIKGIDTTPSKFLFLDFRDSSPNLLRSCLADLALKIVYLDKECGIFISI